MKTELLKTKELNSEKTGCVFTIKLYKQGRYFYVTSSSNHPFLAYMKTQKPPRFKTLQNAEFAFGKVQLREDGMLVYGHSYELEG